MTHLTGNASGTGRDCLDECTMLGAIILGVTTDGLKGMIPVFAKPTQIVDGVIISINVALQTLSHAIFPNVTG